MNKLSKKEFVAKVQRRENLESVDISEMNLARTDLREVKLKNANCGCTDFSDSILMSAELSEAHLVGANFQGLHPGFR